MFGTLARLTSSGLPYLSHPRCMLSAMYDTRPFIATDERVPGFHDVACDVTWTPRNHPTAARTVFGDFLDADSPDGSVTLGCGIELCMELLGIDFVDYDHIVGICDLVNRQLASQPWAELRCPQGTARVELSRRAFPDR